MKKGTENHEIEINQNRERKRKIKSEVGFSV